MVISKCIGKKYVIELSMLEKIRSFKDGITFFELTTGIDYSVNDHNPQFQIMLLIMNFKIAELDIFNKYHLEDDLEDE